MISQRVHALLIVCLAAAISIAGTTRTPAQERDRPPSLVSEFPLVSDDGQPVPNHTIKPPGPLDALPGVVIAANPDGHKTLVEFYDLNCPYCRAASGDITRWVAADPELRLVLVPYPVLGIASIIASRVELAVAKLGPPQKFYAFYRDIFAQRGVIDGERALEVAARLGFDKQALTKIGDSDEIAQTMKDHLRLGTALGLVVTPSFVVGRLAVLGYPGHRQLRAVVDAVSACGKVKC